MSFFNELKDLEEQGIDLIEVLGQDRHLESPEALQTIVLRLARSGENLYSELLYYLTYRRFPPEQAENIWKAIMKHKRRLQEKLGRSVSFRVAALEYLTSRNVLLRGVHLIARPEFETILSFVNIDEVTSVYSRRYFNARLAEELNRARRYGSMLSLLLIDLDNFKTVNESDGHLQGDAILRRLGRLLRDSTRQTDAPCRFGGDEFAILLPQTNREEALATAERIRSAAAGIRVHGKAGRLEPLTLSIGGATFPADCEEPEELIALADQMCLEAKRAGKNCVRLYGGQARAEA
jgi:diguanylate cyclase (GGDEF)-like protein